MKPDDDSGGTDKFIAAAVDRLPIGVGIVDENGRVIARGGGLAGLLSERISAPTEESSRWRILDEAGRETTPDNWPVVRALRGEEVRGVAGTYRLDSGGTRHLRLYSTPLTDGDGPARALLLLQDATHEQEALDQMREALEQGAASASLDAAPAAADSPLTNREREVLRLFAWGHSRKDIAAKLGIAVKTAEFYQAAGMRKLGLKNRIDVVTYALEQGWMATKP